MKKLIAFLMTVICFLYACNNEPKKVSNTENESTFLDSARYLINDYTLQEKRALDSIQLYDIDSLFMECTKMMYVIYGREKVLDVTRNKSVTIGECDIRPYAFVYQSPDIRRLDLEVFWPDSLPVNALFSFESLGAMKSSFTINIKQKSLINTSQQDVVYTPVENFKAQYAQSLNDLEFQKYIKDDRNKINPKFKRLL